MKPTRRLLLGAAIGAPFAGQAPATMPAPRSGQLQVGDRFTIEGYCDPDGSLSVFTVTAVGASTVNLRPG
jgi:hypothetical protein